MKKFILGYEVDKEDLILYPDKQTASFCSEEWVEIEANSLEEAKAKYEESFDNWRKNDL